MLSGHLSRYVLGDPATHRNAVACQRQRSAETVTARQLAEMVTSVTEGGFIMVKPTNDAGWVQRQIAAFRHCLRLLFQP